MQSEYYEILIHKQLSGVLSEEETRELEAWLEEAPEHRRRFEESRDVWAMAEEARFEVDVDLGHEMARFKARISTEKERPNLKLVRMHHVWRYAAVAAVLLIGIGFGLRYGMEPGDGEMASVATGAGETKQVVLPDQSVVLLNENSQLSYAAAFNQRAVQVDGEAFFDVQHDPERPFTVQGGNAWVEVLGTSFNVRHRTGESEIQVTVASGRVAMGITGTDQREVLEPGYQGVLRKADGTLTKRVNEDLQTLGWRQKSLDFDDIPFAELVPRLREHFAIVIQEPTAELGTCRVTGSLVATEVAAQDDEIIELFGYILNVDVAVIDGVYVFSGTGCRP